MRDRIIHDYNEGVRHLAFMIRTKFSFWEDLPFALCGICHVDDAGAKAAAAFCLSLYDSRAADTTWHPVSRVWLDPDGPLRQGKWLLWQRASPAPTRDLSVSGCIAGA